MLGVVSHSVYIVKIVSLRQGGLSRLSHNPGWNETSEKHFLISLKLLQNA